MLSKQICEYNTILEMNCAMCVDKSTSATCISDAFTLGSQKSALPSLLTYTWRCENITARYNTQVT
jgi:hypothetical protein